MLKKITVIFLLTIFINGLVPVVQGIDNIELKNILMMEYLTGEAGIAITKDLDLSKINALTGTYSYTVLWTSSNDKVLRVSGEKGLVNRIDVDVRVILTAQIQNTSVMKDFPLTIKSIYADVRISDNFYYPGYGGKSITETPLASRGFSILNNTTNGNFEAVLTDSYSINTHRISPDATDYRSTRFSFSDAPKAADFQTKLMLAPNLEHDTGTNLEMFFFVYGRTSTNSLVKLLEFRFVCYGTNGYALNVSEAKNPTEWTRLCSIPQSGEWFDFTLSIDTQKCTYDIYINNERKTPASRVFQEGTNTASKLSYLYFNPYRYATNFAVYMDEVAVSYPIPGVTFGNPVFKKIEESGQTPIPCPNEGVVRTEIPVTNTSSAAKQVTLITAAYDKVTKSLVGVSSDTKLVISQVTLACDINMLPSYEYKYFLMDSLDKMIPYYAPVTAPFGVTSTPVGINGQLGVKISWLSSFNSEVNSPEQYIIYRKGIEIGRVDNSALEYVDFEQNAFVPQGYEVESCSVYGKRSERSVMAYQPQSVYCAPVEVTDNMTGRTWRYLDFFGKSIMRSYFTQRSWTMDNERFIFSDANKFIYEYNTETYMVKKIGEYFGTNVSMTMASNSNHFYFINRNKQIVKMDMDSYAQTVVKQLPDGVYLVTDLNVSNDETVISLDAYIHQDGIPVDGRIAWYDVTKDELHLDVWRDFTEIDGEGYYSMHVNINPVYTNMLLYCSGGAYTGPAPYRSYTRIWMHNIVNGEDYNFFKQYQLGYSAAGVNLGEQNCHEAWTSDGEYLVINKASSNPRLEPTHIGYAGIVLLNKNGRDRRYVGMPKRTVSGVTYDMYLTHPGVSPVNARWVIADQTYNYPFNLNHWPIYLIDVDSGKMVLVANPPHNGTSEYHPHPSMSQDGNKVIFGTTSEAGVGRIGWMDISDLVSVPQNGQRVQLSDSCEALDYTEFEYDLEPVQVSGMQAYRVQNGKKMYFNVNNDVVWGVKKDVTLSVTYLDSGTQPMKLEYYVWMDELPTHKLDQRTLYIDRTGTNQWKTVNVTLEGINLDNMELLGTDMKLSGVYSDVLIKEIIAHQ